VEGVVEVVLYNPAEQRIPRVPMVPLGLVTIGDSLADAGYTVRIVDGRVEKNPREMILDSLGDDTVCFGVGCLSGTPIHDALEVIEFVKGRRPDIPVILGGFHASLLPEQTIEHPLVDILVLGHGEETLKEVVTRLKEGKSLEGVEGVYYKENGTIKEGRICPILDFSKYNPPTLQLIHVKDYIKPEVNEKTIDYITSRGCPHRCTFCAIKTLYKESWSSYPVDRVVDEMEKVVKEYGVNGFHLLDDNFFVDIKRVKKICEKIMEKKLNIKIWSMCRLNYFSKFTPEFLEKLKEAGFDTFNFGAESGSPRILEKINKDITVDDIIESARICKQHGFRSQFSFMIGFPYETREDVWATIDVMDKVYRIDKTADLKLLIYTPLPGTQLFKESIRQGFEAPTSLKQWGDMRYERASTPWVEKNKGLYEALTHISYFAFTPTIEKKLKKRYHRLGYLVMKKIALLRWNRRFFKFPLEWKLAGYYIRSFGKRGSVDLG